MERLLLPTIERMAWRGKAVHDLFVNPLLYLALPFLGMIYQDALNQTWLNAA